MPPRIPKKPRVDLQWNRYYHGTELLDAMRRIAAAYPDFVKLESIGTSVEGRDLLLATVNDPSTGKDTDKPAFWCDGNIHGNEVQGAEACVYLMWWLCETRDSLPRVKTLLAERSFYILPSLNPDGRAHWFDAPNTASSSRGGKRPVDNDRDGAFDEDGPNDLDGDGELLQMRVADPNGDYKLDPDDPRVMVRVKPGEKGTHRMLGREGIDDDGDGRINEDGPGGYDPNRDWPSQWRGPAEQYGAGPYPLSLPESRAVADFLVAHPNVASFQSFHNAGGMILRGPGSKSFGNYPRRDDRAMQALATKGEKMLPFYRSMVIWKDLYQVYGGEKNFAYETLGIFAFTNELWTRSQYYERAPDPERRRQERLEFDDHVEMGARFVDWKPFDHPQLGPIELGGWRKETGRVAPSFMIEEMLHRNVAFVIYHAEEMPLVRAGTVKVKPLGNDFHEVTASFSNQGLIPTRSQRSADKKIGAPDRAILTSPDGLTVISSGRVSVRTGRVDNPELTNPARLELTRGIDGDRAVHVRFVVRGTGKGTITYRAEKGGRATLDFTTR